MGDALSEPEETSRSCAPKNSPHFILRIVSNLMTAGRTGNGDRIRRYAVLTKATRLRIDVECREARQLLFLRRLPSSPQTILICRAQSARVRREAKVCTQTQNSLAASPITAISYRYFNQTYPLTLKLVDILESVEGIRLAVRTYEVTSAGTGG